MHFVIRFRGPYDSVDVPSSVCLITHAEDDETASRAFRRIFPNAEVVSAKVHRSTTTINARASDLGTTVEELLDGFAVKKFKENGEVGKLPIPKMRRRRVGVKPLPNPS